jgi:hypothetical protein
MRKLLLLGLVLSIVVAAPAHGAAWGVDDTTDTPIGQACPGFTGCSLREAITSTEANPGADAILVSGGTYPLTNGQLTVTQDLQVARVGATPATLSGSNASRIFNVSGSGIDLVVRFLTLTNGSASGDGGAIQTGAGTTLGIESSTISNSTATLATGASGGAISAGGSVSIGVASGSTTGSSITGNTVSASNAGSAALGGGVAAAGPLTIGARTTISGNQATDAGSGSSAQGGGIFTAGGTSITAATVSGNQVTGGSGVGGGVAGSAGTITLIRSTVSGNSALSTANSVTGGGGGIGVVVSGTGDIASTMSTIANNTVSTSTVGGGTTVFGGGIANLRSGGAIALTNSTLAGNAATTTGASAARAGGVYTAAGTATVAASILAENTQASSTSQCAGGALVSSGYSLLGDISACTYTPGTSDVTNVADAGIDPLADHGGLTQTMALQTGPGLDLVPALNALCSTQATDQRGISRPQAGNCDAGAFEARPATLTITPDPRSTPTVAFSGTTSANVAVSNAGDLATPAAIGFSIASPFSVTAGCTSPVAGGSNCTATITVTPVALGSASQTLTASSGSLSDTATVNGFVFGNTVAPALTGGTAPLVGGSLSVGDGSWNLTPSGFAREWLRCDADGVSNCATIGGASDTSYGTVEADVGRSVRGRVTATASGVSEPALSAASDVIGFVNTAAPVLSGGNAPKAGDTLSVSDGTWTATPTGFTRVWQRCDADGLSNCAAIGGATGASYNPVSADVGRTLRASVTATRAQASAGPVFTIASGVVAALPSGPSQPPTDVFGIPLTPDCELAGAVMLDVRRVGKRVQLAGLAPLKAAGKRVTIKASRGRGRVTARIKHDGSFSASLKAPSGKNAGSIRYAATLGRVTSTGLRLDRRFILLSKRSTAAGLVIRARVVGGRPGLRVTLRRALPCTGREEHRTLKLGRGGVMSAVLPRPTATEKLAFYRVYTNLPHFPVWTLPIVVRAT